MSLVHQVSVKLLELIRSPRVLAGTFSDQNDVEAVLGLVNGIMQERGPKREATENRSPFYKAVGKRMELFFERDAPAGYFAKKGKPGQSEVLRGGEALTAQYLEVKEAIENDVKGRDVLMKLRPLKTFSYALAPAPTCYRCWEITDFSEVCALRQRLLD